MTASLLEGLHDTAARARIPLGAQVDLTMRCNEMCTHCYRVEEKHRAELTTDEIKGVLDDLARIGTLYLTFSGGEVFLRPDLMELVAYAKALRFDLGIKTNALLVTDAAARQFRALGVRKVDVSIYSADPASHDRITGVPGSLERSLAGVRRLIAAGLRVKLACPLMADTFEGRHAVQALADAVGAAVGFDPMITARNDGHRAPMLLRISPVANGALVFERAPEPAGPPLREACSALDDTPCGAGHTACYIGAYGDVTPCVAMPLVCGNVRETPFAEIWSRSPAFQRVRAIRKRDLLGCRDCQAAPYCTRCPGQALIEEGDLTAPSLAACEHAMGAAAAAGVRAIPAPFLKSGQFQPTV